ncbi:lycopene cyclase domain-containing protein [Cryobacterium sp. 10I1]|uniref:lycopene cyclase domain-containing protein n=1 Tax=Cryobacterium sp. 10I1 TaxID=3048578 RepID=UPI002B2386AC|nr:lycopene cyclase domain-containing protein [Cryobacterium sp. 10I1]MEB0305788.1 lycopene cyclase domain-containing protein [Cryobacterium sp. 10I1]
MSDSGEKTEQATDKRMKEVRAKGQLSKSQDLTAWIGIGSAAALAPVTISLGSQAGASQLDGLHAIVANPSPELAEQLMGDAFSSLAGTLTPMLATVFAVVLAIGVAFLLAWDAGGITAGIFYRGETDLMTGIQLAPELPLEELFFLTFLCYLTMNAVRGAELLLERGARRKRRT